MKLHSPLPHKKARIEIIPLIDIMFFLLAVMMMVSLNMVQMKGIKLNLPTAATATPENKSDFLTISVAQDGQVYVDKVLFERPALVDELKRRKADKPDVRIYIQADAQAINGDVIAVLDKVRAAGIQKVAFQTRPDSGGGASAPAPAKAPSASNVVSPAPTATAAATPPPATP